MNPITLVSDVDPEVDDFLFSELIGLCNILLDVGHRVRVWLSSSAQAAFPPRRGLDILSPCPHWKVREVFKALPYFIREKIEILHVIPRESESSRLHVFSVLLPLLKNLHQPALVSHFLGWPDDPSAHCRQLLNLSDLVLTPSENLRQIVSADPSSTAHQRFACFPLLVLPGAAEEFTLPNHLQNIKPFMYVPGAWNQWQDPVFALEKLLRWSEGWKGLIVVDPGWNQHSQRSLPLRKIVAQNDHRVIFLEKMSRPLQTWLFENAEFVYAAGLLSNSLMSLQIRELHWRSPLPALFSAPLGDHFGLPAQWRFNEILTRGPLTEQGHLRERLLKELRESVNRQRGQKAVIDPANELNRLYSQSLLR